MDYRNFLGMMHERVPPVCPSQDVVELRQRQVETWTDSSRASSVRQSISGVTDSVVVSAQTEITLNTCYKK